MSKALDPKDTCVLVTGGAGFIGSHTLLLRFGGGYQGGLGDDLSHFRGVDVELADVFIRRRRPL